MQEPLYFGDPARPLFGLRHLADGRQAASVLLCSPLLQEGIRCHRALWALGQALASKGLQAGRFDWYGSGDSGGDSTGMDVPGLAADIVMAQRTLGSGGAMPSRIVALRSAALPVLLHASLRAEPVDLVLWSPVMEGAELVPAWREQHRRQLHAAGRFLKPPIASSQSELLGFEVTEGFLQALQALRFDTLVLPVGSRVTLLQWQASEHTEEFMRRQNSAGVSVESLLLDTGDEPDWDNPDLFETQILPRRAVARVAAYLAETA